jgi:tripartite-type tricarboxylate transporter receptor subunit TctC
LPVQSMAELVAYAKANPGKLSAGYGNSTGRITIETMKRRLDIDIVPVAYRSNPAAVTDLMAGHIQMGVPDFSTGLPMLKAGKIRALAVLTKERDATLPDVPTLDATVMPGYDLLAWTGIFAPAGVPQNVVDVLAKPIEKTLASDEVRERFRTGGVEIYWIGSAGFSDYVKVELVKWTTLIKAAGIEPE